ncbi:MAG TPA: diguanylate cyclase [Marinagarivorans sp.]
MGAVDYILKPASLSVVLARVRAHLLNAHQQKALSTLTYLDHLTQIPNRRRFNETLRLEHKRAIRDQSPLSILMIDIDHFKRYNDTFGHLKGDECIKVVAQALVTCQRRPADLTCRFGGEEFVALLPDSDEEGALHIARLMRNTVETLGIEQTPDAAHPFLTVSIGTATMYPDALCSEHQLVGAADKMLYNAKLNGRNCIQSKKLQCAIA